jgi:hypothetical protein
MIRTVAGSDDRIYKQIFQEGDRDQDFVGIEDLGTGPVDLWYALAAITMLV